MRFIFAHQLYVGICDDDSEIQDEIIRLLKHYPQSRMQKIFKPICFSSGKEILAYEGQLDLLYLDIELGDGLGINLVPALRAKYPEVTIVFISTYSKYFIYSHRLHVFQFLTKPFDQKIFYEELHRFILRYQRKHAFYSVIIQERKLTFPISEILYLEAALRHLMIYHCRLGRLEKVGQISQEEQKLEQYGFIRCHRGYLVNARHIKKISGLELTLSNPVNQEEIKLAISKQRRIQVERQYHSWLLEQEGS